MWIVCLLWELEVDKLQWEKFEDLDFEDIFVFEWEMGEFNVEGIFI